MLRKIFAHRMAAWLWLSLLLLVAIAVTAPTPDGHYVMARLVLSKVTFITAGGYLGFLLSLAIDGALAGRDRPHDYREQAEELRRKAALITPEGPRRELLLEAWHLELVATHMLWRRALVVSAVLVAVAMGA